MTARCCSIISFLCDSLRFIAAYFVAVYARNAGSIQYIRYQTMLIELQHTQISSLFVDRYYLLIDGKRIPVHEISSSGVRWTDGILWFFDEEPYVSIHNTSAHHKAGVQIYRIESDTPKTLTDLSASDYDKILFSAHSELICSATESGWTLSTGDVLKSDCSFWTVFGLRTDKWYINGSKVIEQRYYGVFRDFSKRIRGIHSKVAITTDDARIIPALLGVLIRSNMSFG